MDDLYAALKELNTIADAYENWSAYREKLTSFIIDAVNEPGTLLAVGAGECNDLDLKRLVRHFSGVALLDIDAQSMLRGLERQGVSKADVTVIRADLVGIPETRYEAFGSSLLKKLRFGERVTAEDFAREMTEAFSVRVPDALPGADTVVCCGVHSQLFSVYPRMAAAVASAAGIDMAEVLRTAARIDGTLMHTFNDVLFGAARRTLIVGAETERVGMEGGIEGAAQALEDLGKRKKPRMETRLLWPFSPGQGKRYRMFAAAYDGPFKGRI